MKSTLEKITNLKPNQVFVYGANEAGMHGAGAAKLALKWGAKLGQYGFNGQTYGIPTKDKYLYVLPLEAIRAHVNKFVEFAKTRPDLEFLVTKIGTGLAGYSVGEIAPLFIGAYFLKNIILPIEFVGNLELYHIEWLLTSNEKGVN